MTQKLYKIYQAYEKLGIIRISIVKSYDPSGDWIDYTRDGMRKEIFIEKTDVGEKLAKRGGLPQKDGWLVIKQGIFRVDEIVKNEARRKGIDNYCVIMATYTAE